MNLSATHPCLYNFSKFRSQGLEEREHTQEEFHLCICWFISILLRIQQTYSGFWSHSCNIIALFTGLENDFDEGNHQNKIKYLFLLFLK